MSKTTDTANLFQSDAQHERAEARAVKHERHRDTGYPITLASKPLSVTVRQAYGKEAEAWTAESGFVVRRLGLESGKTKQIYRGHLGPVTSLGFYRVPASGSRPARDVLLSGSWDKSLRVWDIQTKSLLSTTVGHVDFVKTLLVISGLSVVVTGSSDRDIRIWDLSPLEHWDWDSVDNAAAQAQAGETCSSAETVEDAPPRTGAAPPAAVSSAPLPLLGVLKGHTRPVECLARYDITAGSPTDLDDEPVVTGRVALLSADSMGALRTWELWRQEDGTLASELRSHVRHHEVGIYDLVVGDNEIWTASADGSVLLCTFDPSSPAKQPQPTLRIPHPAGVKAVLPLPLAVPSLNSSHLLTGGADEQIYQLDLSDSRLDTSNKLTALPTWPAATANGAPLVAVPPGHVSTIEGHSHEVTALKAFIGPASLPEPASKDAVGAKHKAGRPSRERTDVWILSASVDGTLRRWRWRDIVSGTTDTAGKPAVKAGDAGAADGDTVDGGSGESEWKQGMMTAEEEAELEALMADD